MASEGNGQQQEAALVIPKEVEVTAVLEEIVMTVSTANAGRPTDISVLHDYAMDHLFSFLPMADLKNCRLVNRSWNLASNQAILKSKYAIRFQDDGGPRLFHKIEDIPKLAQQIRSSSQFPWTKFTLLGQRPHHCTMTCDNDTLQLQLANLLCVINPIVTELNISFYNLMNLPSLELEYPNLRKLFLWGNHLSDSTESNWMPLLHLVETASKINEIAIFGPKTPLYMDILEIPNCRKITQLTLGHWIVGEQLVRISKMDFQLKFLLLTFEVAEVTPESIRAVLLSQSNCLEHLELNCDDKVSSSEQDESMDPQWLLGMEFPRMEKLKILIVHPDNLYSNISYKDMFPELKKLEVIPISCEDSSDQAAVVDDSFFNDNIEPVETVEYLKFKKESRSPEAILQAARQFPKLRSIRMTVSQNLLNIPGNTLPSMEEMELAFWGNKDMESILTGLLSEEMDTLKDLPINQLGEKERSKENLHFLKNLKKLRLINLSFLSLHREIESLSDVVCRFALLKMDHLQVLELQGHFGQISDQVMKSLESMREKFVVLLENWTETNSCSDSE